MIIKIIFALVIILIFGLYIFSKLKGLKTVENHQNILVLDDISFEKKIKNKVVIVDFWAEWCMPCKIMAPILNDLSSELPDNKGVGKLDIEAFPKIAQKYGIRNIPTLIVFKNGKEVERIIGIKQKNFLKQVLEKY